MSYTRLVLILCSLTAISSGSLAQSAVNGQPADGGQPGTVSEGDGSDAERRVPRAPGEVESFAPESSSGRSPIRPGLTSGTPWELLLSEGDREGTGGLLAERSFLNRLRGEVISGPHATRIFVADASAERTLPPMLLLPTTELERFDEFVFKRNERVPAKVSGLIFRYAGRNYLLPRSLVAAAASPLIGGSEDDSVLDAGAAVSADNGPEVGADDRAESGVTTEELGQVRRAEIDSLIDSLDRRPVYNRRRQRELNTSSDSGKTGTIGDTGTAPAVDNAAGFPSTTGNGGYLSAQRGRMVRSPDGSWVFVSDDEGRGGVRLTLLPCRMLERLEGVALREGDSAVVTLSGRVHRYKGDGYLLPTLFERERRAGVDPLQ